jgi:hypothetical protein
VSTPRRLVVDYIRRQPSNLVIMAAVVMFVWGNIAFTGRSMPWSAAFSMALVFLFSVLAITSFVPRPLLYLPVSRGDIWKSQWLLSTVVATAAATGGKLLAVLVQSQRGIQLEDGSTGVGAALEAVALSGLCDFAYGGSFPAAIWLTRAVARKAGRGVVSNIAFFMMCVWFLGGFFWGFVMRSHLPLSWGAAAGMPGVALLAALALAIGASQYVPPTTARGEIPRPVGPSAMAPDVLAVSSRLTGSLLLIVREVRINVTFVVLVFLLGWVGRVLTIESTDWWDVVNELRAALATDSYRLVAHVVPLIAALYMLPVSVRNGIQPLIRHLRVLPIGAWRLNALILATSTASVVVACGLFILLKLLLAQRPPHGGDVAVIAALSGLAALTQSIQLRLRQAWSLAGLGVVLIVGLVAELISVPQVEPLLTPVSFGGAAMVIAALMNHRWLTRSAMTYRPSAEIRTLAVG